MTLADAITTVRAHLARRKAEREGTLPWRDPVTGGAPPWYGKIVPILRSDGVASLGQLFSEYTDDEIWEARWRDENTHEVVRVAGWRPLPKPDPEGARLDAVLAAALLAVEVLGVDGHRLDCGDVPTDRGSCHCYSCVAVRRIGRPCTCGADTARAAFAEAAGRLG